MEERKECKGCVQPYKSEELCKKCIGKDFEYYCSCANIWTPQ